MAQRKNPATEFGLEIMLYCAKTGITQKELSQKAAPDKKTS